MALLVVFLFWVLLHRGKRKSIHFQLAHNMNPLCFRCLCQLARNAQWPAPHKASLQPASQCYRMLNHLLSDRSASTRSNRPYAKWFGQWCRGNTNDVFFSAPAMSKSIFSRLQTDKMTFDGEPSLTDNLKLILSWSWFSAWRQSGSSLQWCNCLRAIPKSLPLNTRVSRTASLTSASARGKSKGKAEALEHEQR